MYEIFVDFSKRWNVGRGAKRVCRKRAGRLKKRSTRYALRKMSYANNEFGMQKLTSGRLR